MTKREQQMPKGYFVDDELTASELTLVERTLMGGIRTLCKGSSGEKAGTYAWGGQWSETDRACSARLNLPLRTVREARRSLMKKGWLQGTKLNGNAMSVRMPSDWYEARGVENLSNMAPEQGGQEECEKTPYVRPVTSDDTSVTPDVTPVTCGVTPSDSRSIGDSCTNMSEAPVAPAGAGATAAVTGAGAALNFKEGTACGAGPQPPRVKPLLPPEIEQALREEAEAWTEQVADMINTPIRNRQTVFPLKDEDGVVRRIKCRKMTGSSPWPRDCEKVLALAMDLAADDVDLHDPRALFRSYLRTRSARPPMRQRLQEHAYRAARAATARAAHISQECVTELADAPQIKIAALFRKPGDHEAMRENEERIGYVKSCRFDADPEMEAALREALDPRNEYSNQVWDRCWREGGARCRAYGDFDAYVELVKAAHSRGQYECNRLPLPWSVDNVSEESIISQWFCDGAGEVMGRPYDDWGHEDMYALFLHLRQESMSVDDGREFIFAKGKAWAKPRVAARFAPRPVPAPVASEGSGGGLGLS